ncbi:hypothetical protein [Salinarimonas rosea]|uniref:hypothetical protein n=1 Tax=Salinarimonas rosea TaxID=552063 RepID=UPI0003FE2485|nr:hypothetical protein [Salinarimonas rosea]
MTATGKHPKTQVPSDRDLKSDPGIGRSKGQRMAGTEGRPLQGENTWEGDVMNDVDDTGAVKPEDTGRTNR